MANGEVIRATVAYSVPGASEVLNVFMWEQLGPADDVEIGLDLVEWVTQSWHPRWLGLGGMTTSIISMSLDILNLDGTVNRDLGAEVLGLPGSINSEVLPPNDAAMLFAPTVLPKVRGRKYIPGLTSGAVEGGVFNANTLADLAILALPYISDYFGLTGTTYIPGVLRVAANLFQPLSKTVGFDDVVDSQRRRRGDRGS